MELYLSPERPQRDFKTKRFLKGHVPFNKGKKWGEYASKEAQEKMLKAGLKNLRRGRGIGGWNKRKVVGVTDDGQFFVFASSVEAARKVGVHCSNVRKCCKKKRKHAGGIQWFYEDDNEWTELVNNR